MNDNIKVGVIIPAAGSGSRMGGIYKPFEMLCGKPMLLYSLEAFEKCRYVSFVVIAAREDKISECEKLCAENGITKVKKIVCGGDDRQTSVENAFSCGLFEEEKVDFVAMHDAARPLITPEMIEKAVEFAVEKSSAVCASRVRDTVKRAELSGAVTGSVDRENLYLLQTPQIFRTDMYRKALVSAREKGFVATDESTLVSALGEVVYLFEMPSYNIKVTYPEDVFLAEALLGARKDEKSL